MTILIESGGTTAASYLGAVPGPVAVVDGWPGLVKAVADAPDELLVVIGPDEPLDPALAFAGDQRLARPTLGVVLLRRRLDVQVLGAALRAGVREVVLPDDSAALEQACERSLQVSRRAAGWQPQESGRPDGRLVTVFSAKGGCGKTTLSTNIAAALAEGGRRSVCLVDLDLAFGDVAIALQLFPTRSLADAVGMRAGLDEAGVKALLTPHSPGFDTLLAPREPGDAEKIPAQVVSEVLARLRQSFDYVVVDTPPSFTDSVLAALDVTDVYVLLATLDIPALKNLRLSLDMLELLDYPKDNWHVVLNRSDSKVGLDVADVEKTLKTGVAALVPSSRAVPASVNKGVPIVLDQPDHPVSRAIRSFVDGSLVRRGGHGEAANGVLPQRASRFSFGRRRKAVSA